MALFTTILEAILNILLWVAVWGVSELLILAIAKDNVYLQFLLYLMVGIVAGVLLWYLIYS